MTEDKQFKQRVRARMKKTGERYAVARHHLLNESAADTRTIRGTLTGAGPLRGAWVWLSAGDFDLQDASTCRVGRTAYGWQPPTGALAVDATGAFELSALADQCLLFAGAVGHASQPLDLRAATKSLEVSLVPTGVAELPLAVRAPDGSPLRGKTVALEVEGTTGGGRPLHVELDDDGQARVELEPSEYRVRVHLAEDKACHSAWEIRTLTAGSNPRAVFETSDTDSRPAVTIQVVDAAGTPLPGARVGAFSNPTSRLLGADLCELVPPGRGSRHTSKTLVHADDAGRVTFAGLEPGAWLFAARSAWHAGRSEVLGLDFTSGATELQIVADEPTGTGHLRVVFRGLEGTKLEGVTEFRLRTAEGRELLRFMGPTDYPYPQAFAALAEDGSTLLWDLPPGPLGVTFEGKRAVPGPSLEGFTAIEAGATATLELTHVQTATLHGRVVTATGDPARGELAAVYLTPQRTIDSKTELELDGAFELHVDPQRPYELRLCKSPGTADHVFHSGLLPTLEPGQRDHGDTPPLLGQVDAGETPPLLGQLGTGDGLTLQIPEGPSVRVLDPNGLPLEGATVPTLREGEARWSRPTTDVRGFVRYPGLKRPLARLSVNAEGYEQLDLVDVTLPLVVTLHPSATKEPQRAQVSGRVLDASGQPLENVAVSAYTRGRGGPGAEPTGGDGRFVITSIEPGRVSLEAKRMDLGTAFVAVDLASGESRTIDLRLEPGVPVTGHLRGKDTSPYHARHVLRVVARCGEQRTSVTPRAGTRFDLGRLAPGTWTVQATRKGERIGTPLEVNVIAGADPLELELNVSPPEL